MNLRMWRGSLALVLLVLLVASLGCGRRPQPAPPTEQPPTQPPPREMPTEQPPAEQPVVTFQFQDVYFEYDRSAIRASERPKLDNNGRHMVENSQERVVLEGHCDERGTVEYNLALGQRRADSVRNYLVSYGVDGGRMRTISYGEERPFALGSNEEAWAQNRRVHFVRQ